MKTKALAPVVDILRRGGVGVLPTDTIYGIVGSALRPATVRRIYRLRRRDLRKPMIILIGDIGDLAKFGVRLTPHIKKLLNRVWPGKVSVVLPISGRDGGRFLTKFSYLHRGTGTLAFRLPRPRWLRDLLLQSGPLVAPSANFEGESPAKTIKEAKKYFGKEVEFYVDGMRRKSKASTLIKIEKGIVVTLRH
jgi:L-threonylcarbamoyladenylate synthase